MSATTAKPRTYNQSGLHRAKTRLPALLGRARDVGVPDHDLSELELSVRQWRDDLVRDHLGNDPAAGKLILLDMVIGDLVLLHTVDGYLATVNPINKRDRRLYSVVLERGRLADGLTKRLQLLGLERQRSSLSLTEYILSKQQTPDGAESTPDVQNTAKSTTEAPVPVEQTPEGTGASTGLPGGAEGVTP